MPPWPSDRAAILRELRDATADGVDRRLGPDYTAFHPAGTKPEMFPEIWMAPSKQDPGGRRYQIGGPWTKKGGDFSSTQGQVLYAPDGSEFPVDRVNVLEWSNGTFSERPEAPWNGGFRPDPASKNWKAAAPNGVGMPVGMARGYGSWANCGVIVFSSGLISAAGTVTGRGTEPTLQLPPNKIPTAISITNKNEFALITVCDTETHRGQVAVVSIGVNGRKVKFVHEWQDESWSLPNVAVITGLKLLGYIDLPGIEFPTSVSAVGNAVGGRMNGRDGNAGLLREYDIAKQADRDVFLSGSNRGYSSKAGFAVVAGKYEGKAAFLDLQPLFEKVREQYFTTDDKFKVTRDSGPEAKQWPPTFEGEPAWKPPVVAVIEVKQPTSVLASMSGGAKARAYIASLDGTIGVYAIGGLATEAAADAKEIVRVDEVKVGRNPTCLTYQKSRTSDAIIACSRGDREIAWIKLGDKDLKPDVIRRLKDSRLLDPVHIEMSDTHGVETSLLTAVDFHGKQVVNYRWSQVRFATQGGARFDMGPDGKAEFECGGTLEFPGKPFVISASNVN
jgi:hypothetical protein